MEVKALSISELTNYITQIFDAEELLHNIKIYGEISGFSLVRGNAYFAIKDQNALLNCVCFGAEKYNNIKDGDQVLLTGSPRYYGKQGKLQFYAVSIVPYGMGILYQQFLALKEKLEKEGLFDAETKKLLPKQIKNIGVVSSQTGAAIQDIFNVATRRNPMVNIFLYPVRVQGEGADVSIIEGINYFSKAKNVDVIVVARGGGSFEDLNCFNSEKLARIIFECELPTISAVGHETDFTICDFVCSLRAPTPSAAAEIVTADMGAKLGDIVENLLRMNNAIDRRLSDSFNFVDSAMQNFVYNMQHLIEQKQAKYISIIKHLALLQDKTYYDKINTINLLTNTLDNLNPAKLLLKGYTNLMKSDKVITSIKQIAVGDEISARLPDGKVKTKIVKIEE